MSNTTVELFSKHSELIWAIRRGDIDKTRALLQKLAELNPDHSLQHTYVDYIECAVDYGIKILAVILHHLKSQSDAVCSAHFKRDYKFVERALYKGYWDSAKLLVYFRQNFSKQNGILTTLDRVINSKKANFAPSNQDWCNYLEFRLRQIKKGEDPFPLYYKAYQYGILTFKLTQCKQKESYAFFYRIESQAEEYLNGMELAQNNNSAKIEPISVIGLISDTCFQIDALPSDLLNLVFKQLMPRDILALNCVSKGTLKALDHLDSRYHIWKVQYNRQKYHPPSDTNFHVKATTTNWRGLVTKQERIRTNWTKGNFEVNYLTAKHTLYQECSNDHWMLLRDHHRLRLWNCNEQRFWSSYPINYPTVAVFVDEGTETVPPVLALRNEFLGMSGNILVFKRLEEEPRVIRITNDEGDCMISFCSDNKLHSRRGYYDLESEEYISYPVGLNNIQRNTFNEQICYCRNNDNSLVLLDAKNNMSVMQTLQFPTEFREGAVRGFVDEFSVLHHQRDYGDCIMTLHDIRKWQGPFATITYNRYAVRNVHVDEKNFRIVCTDDKGTFRVLRSNTLQEEGVWHYNFGLHGINGRYMIGIAPPNYLNDPKTGVRRTLALDFNI